MQDEAAELGDEQGPVVRDGDGCRGALFGGQGVSGGGREELYPGNPRVLDRRL